MAIKVDTTQGFNPKYPGANPNYKGFYEVKFDPFMANEIGRQEAIAKVFKDQRLKDMAEGRARGEELFGKGSLGRLDETDQNRLVEMMRGRLGGYTSPEHGALRDKMNRELSRAYKGSKSELMKAQGYTGTGGAASAAQFAKLLKERDRGAQEGYQDLLIKNIEAKRGAAQDFSQALSDRQKTQEYNQGRAEKELLNRFQTEMGYASLGSAERAAASQFGAAASQQQQASAMPSSGKF